MDFPPTSHVIYIPVILILGLVLGFIMGSRATRDAYAMQQRHAEDRAKRRAEREQRAGGADPEPRK